MQTWTLVRFLHVAGIVTFVGGLVVLALAVVPALRTRLDEAELRRVVIRFSIVLAAGLALAVGTGIALASEFSLWSSNVLQGKLVLLFLVAALAVLQLLTPSSRAPAFAAAVGALAVLWLGVKLTYG